MNETIQQRFIRFIETALDYNDARLLTRNEILRELPLWNNIQDRLKGQEPESIEEQMLYEMSEGIEQAVEYLVNNDTV